MLAHGDLAPQVVARGLLLAAGAAALMLALRAKGWHAFAGALRRLSGGDDRDRLTGGSPLRATLVADKASFASRRWGPRAAPP